MITSNPASVVIDGDDAVAAVLDGAQRKLAKAVDPASLTVTLNDAGQPVINCIVTGNLKGPKSGVKRGPRKPKPAV